MITFNNRISGKRFDEISIDDLSFTLISYKQAQVADIVNSPGRTKRVAIDRFDCVLGEDTVLTSSD